MAIPARRPLRDVQPRVRDNPFAEDLQQSTGRHPASPTSQVRRREEDTTIGRGACEGKKKHPTSSNCRIRQTESHRQPCRTTHTPRPRRSQPSIGAVKQPVEPLHQMAGTVQRPSPSTRNTCQHKEPVGGTERAAGLRQTRIRNRRNPVSTGQKEPRHLPHPIQYPQVWTRRGLKSLASSTDFGACRDVPPLRTTTRAYP